MGSASALVKMEVMLTVTSRVVIKAETLAGVNPHLVSA